MIVKLCLWLLSLLLSRSSTNVITTLLAVLVYIIYPYCCNYYCYCKCYCFCYYCYSYYYVGITFALLLFFFCCDCDPDGYADYPAMPTVIMWICMFTVMQDVDHSRILHQSSWDLAAVVSRMCRRQLCIFRAMRHSRCTCRKQVSLRSARPGILGSPVTVIVGFVHKLPRQTMRQTTVAAQTTGCRGPLPEAKHNDRPRVRTDSLSRSSTHSSLGFARASPGLSPCTPLHFGNSRLRRPGHRTRPQPSIARRRIIFSISTLLRLWLHMSMLARLAHRSIQATHDI